MGKISLASMTKKAKDVEGLIKPQDDDDLTPTKNSSEEEVGQAPSPTPKNPLSKTKSGCCRKACLFSLGFFIVMTLFVSTAILLDYQQGNLAAHTSQLPREMREFPVQASKYVVEMLYQTPKDLHRIFDGALNWTKKNDSKLVNKGEVLVDEKSRETLEKEQPSLFVEGNDDAFVDDGLLGVAQFFVAILNDVSSIFEASNEVAIDEELKESTSTNEISRNSIKDAESSSESVMMNTATVVNTAQAEQVNTPDAIEHTTENKDDWKDDKIEVMEEILVDGESTKNVPRNKEAFKNILNDGSDVHTH